MVPLKLSCRHWASWLLLLIALVQPARAQQSSPPSLEQARSAFLEGMNLLKEEHWEEATERFLYAAEARRTAGLLYHAAFCLEKLQKYKEALALYEEARELAQQVPAADVQALLPDALTRTNAALPHLTLPDLPTGSVVFVNGQEQASPSDLLLNPGAYTLSIRAPGYEHFETRLSVRAAERRQIPVSLTPVRAPAPEDDQAATVNVQPPPAAKAKPYVVATFAVLSAAGLGAGIYGTIAHPKLKERHDAQVVEIDEESGGAPWACDEPEGSLADLCAERRRLENQDRVAQVLMIAGYSTFGVGLLAAIGTQIFWRPVPVQVTWLQGGGMLGYSGRF